MDGSERLEVLADQVVALEQVQAELIELFIELTIRSQCWQTLMTEQLRQTAELRQTIVNQREELRRYTRANVGVE
jgi:hypothetical protein